MQKKKKKEEQKIEAFQLSPTAASALRDVEFKHIDHPSNPSMLSGFKKYTFEELATPTQYCICGLPCP
jgi:hypothetical protein